MMGDLLPTAPSFVVWPLGVQGWRSLGSTDQDGGRSSRPGRGIGLGPETRLYDIKGQDRPGPDGHSQGPVVDNPQVALKPDDL